MIKLKKIVSSKNPKKKYDAYFIVDGKSKIVSFGAYGYSDFTLHHDEKRKERYINRHRKNENWDDVTSPGALSRWILWNKKTLKESIKDFKKRFNL